MPASTSRAIAGTGPHGRIVERDVEAAKSGGGAKAAPRRRRRRCSRAARRRHADVGRRRSAKLFEPGSYELVPHDNMRKTIARRLVEAKQTIPHFYLTLDCDLDALLAAREQLNAAAPKDKDGKPAYKLSVNDFVIKALALALTRRAGRQRLLDRQRHAQAQARRCRRRRRRSPAA